MSARLCLRLILLVAVAHGAVSAAAAPVAKWNFDEVSGTTAADASGNGHPATVTAPTWVAGRTGNALSFDGITTRVDLPANLVTASAGTIAGWVKTGATFTDYATLFYAADTAPGDGLGPQNELSLHLTTAAKLETQMEGGYAGDVLLTSTGAVNNNQWRHVALTWSAGGTMALFLDGAQIASATHPGVTWSAATLRLGASGLFSRCFAGVIDEVSLYTTALTAVEIRALSGVGTLQFSAATYAVTEGTSTVTCSVTRVGGAAGAVGVSYATAPGTALATSDYTTKTGTLSWADGDVATKTFTVTIINDVVAEVEEAFTVALSSPTGGATLGLIPSATVTITDNDSAGTLKYTAASYAVTEGTATVTATVSRTGGSTGAVTVNYATQDATALAASDYTTTSGTLSWATGDAASKTFTVAITNDTIAESPETLNLLLSAPTGGAFILPSPNSSIAIADNDGAGSLQFTAPVVSVGERTSTVTFTVSRTGGAVGAVGVSYGTSDGTAIAASDYTAKTGTLAWATNDAANKTFTVTILNDAVAEAVEGFNVTLSTPTGGAVLGAQSRCVGRIRDNENPIIQWRLDETTGTSVADSMENGYTGTATAPTWAAGHFANAMTFNGTTSVVTGPTSVVKSDLGAVSLWMKAASAPTADAMLFYGSSVATGNGFGTENELHVHLTTAGTVGAFIEGGSLDVSITSAASYADNAWHHVVFSWDINAQAVLYVDGQQVGSAVHDAANFTCSSKLLLGKPATATNLFTGQIDNVVIYDRALIASEVMGLFDPQPAVTFTTPTTIGVGVTTWDDRTIIVSGTTLTVDGYHRFANLTLQAGAVLTQPACTTTVTSSVNLAVVGTVSIDATSSIDVRSKGYLPGYTVGNTTTGGAGYGSSGSYGGYGGYSGALRNEVYGDFLDPQFPGSGAGAGQSGVPSGGGLIRLRAGILSGAGVISAEGGGSSGLSGSGGGIRLDIASFAFTGGIYANGGYGPSEPAGGGRVAIYYQTGTVDLAQVRAYGGVYYANLVGGNGTVYVQQGANPGTLIAANPGYRGPEATPVWFGDRTTTADDPAEFPVTILGYTKGSLAFEPSPTAIKLTGTSVLDDTVLIGTRFTGTSLTLNNGSVWSHQACTTTAEYRLDAVLTGTVAIDATSSIDVSGKGYLPGYTMGNTTTGGTTLGSSGSYGGYGGINTGLRNEVYGDFRDPQYPGSGAGIGSAGAPIGGGLVRLSASVLSGSGSITAAGTGTSGYSGSGGGIRLDIGTFSFTGPITANGGYGTTEPAGGGRVAIYYQTGTVNFAQVRANGGLYYANLVGGHGTVYVQQGASVGSLIAANPGYRNPEATPIWFGDRTTTADDPAEYPVTILGYTKGYLAFEPSPTAIKLTGTSILDDTILIGNRFTGTNLTLNNGSVWSHNACTATAEYRLDAVLTGTVAIDATSSIDVAGKGYLKGRTVGNTTTGAAVGASGSYGGYAMNNTGATNEVYGDFLDPQYPGSGSGADATGNPSGGGLIRLSVGTLSGSGLILAPGASNNQYAGSGGGIRLDVTTWSFTGLVAAEGSAGASVASGGGRIAIYYQTGSINLAQVSARGVGDYTYGSGPGTVFVQHLGDWFGLLTIDNFGKPTQYATPIWYGSRTGTAPLQPKAPYSFTITVTGGAASVLQGDLTVFDYDGDGVLGWDEQPLGTNPFDYDTNDDGLADGVVLPGINPLASDSDGDGVADTIEIARGTNPFLVDTDHDGFSDAVDVFPLDPVNSAWPAPSPTDVTPPVITLTAPSTLVPLP